MVMILSLMPMNVFGITNPANLPNTANASLIPSPAAVFNPAALDGFVLGMGTNASYIDVTISNIGADSGFQATPITGIAIDSGDFAGSVWHRTSFTTARIYLSTGAMGVLFAATPGAVAVELPTIGVVAGREGDSWNATLTMAFGSRTLFGPSRLFSNPPPTAQLGVNFAITPVTFGGGSLPEANLNALTITELHQGSFGTNLVVELQAPQDYTWADAGAVAVLNNSRTFANIAARAVTTVNERSILTLTISPGAAVLGAIGRLEVTGLRFTPDNNQVLPVADLGVRIRSGNTTSAIAGGRDNWNADPTVAHRRVGGFTTTIVQDPIPLLNSGLASGWNSGTISITSNAPGSFMNNQHVFIDFNQPGVEVVGARYRIQSVGGSWSGWTDSGANIAVFEDRVRITATGIEHNTANRVIEIQFNLRIDPGFVAATGATTINALVNMRGNYDDINREMTVARVRDPIAVVDEDPVAINTVGDVFAFIPPTKVADVTIEEAAVGLLETGRWLYVYVVPTINGRLLPNLFGSDIDFETSLTPKTTGGISLDRGQRVPLANLSEEWRGVPVYRFRVNQLSRTPIGPATITFTDNYVGGSLLHARLPEVEFTFVIAGNAVTNAVAGATAPHNLDVIEGRMPYTVVVGTIAETEADAPFTGQPPQGPGNQLPQLGAALFTLPAASMQNGMIGLAAFAAALEELTGVDANPGFEATATEVFGWFSGINASGQLVKLTVAQGATLAERDINGVPGTVRIDAPINIGGNMFVPVSTITNAFGYASRTVNGTVEFLIP
jgi:hypothetical protein